MKRRPPPRRMIIAITKSFFCLGVSSLKNFFMDSIRKSSLPQARGLVDHEKTVFKVPLQDGRIQGDGSWSLGQKHKIDLANLYILARNHPVFFQDKPFGPYNPPQTQFHRREPCFRDGSIALYLLNGKGIWRKLVHIGHLEELKYLFLVNKPLEHEEKVLKFLKMAYMDELSPDTFSIEEVQGDASIPETRFSSMELRLRRVVRTEGFVLKEYRVVPGEDIEVREVDFMLLAERPAAIALDSTVMKRDFEYRLFVIDQAPGLR